MVDRIVNPWENTFPSITQFYPLNTLRSVYQCTWWCYMTRPPVTCSSISTLWPPFSSLIQQHPCRRLWASSSTILHQVLAPAVFCPEPSRLGCFMVTRGCTHYACYGVVLSFTGLVWNRGCSLVRQTPCGTTPVSCSGSPKCSRFGASVQNWSHPSSMVPASPAVGSMGTPTGRSWLSC